MTILLTGATGFIGSHLLTALIKKRKNKIILLKRTTSSTWRINSLLNKVKTYDIDNVHNIENIFRENSIEAIIHLATLYIKQHSNKEDIVRMNQANILFPSLLLECAEKYKVKTFINTGTLFEYKTSRNKISEESPVEAYNYYAATKLAFEQILKYYNKSSTLKALTLRLFYPYGEKDNAKVIPQIMKAFIREKQLNLSEGRQKLNFTYVGDIADAYLKALTYINSDKYKQYEIFNIGADKVYSIRQIVNIIKHIAKKNIPIKFGAFPYNSNEIMYTNCDYKKANKFLGWFPKNDIEQGLQRTYNYYQQKND